MLFISAGQLAALALSGLQAASLPAPCGCGQFRIAKDKAVAGEAALSAQARQVRDFVLFSHRRIGADLIARRGPYLDTLAGFFPHCADQSAKLAWFRQLLASTSDTPRFAERIAQQADASRACPSPAR